LWIDLGREPLVERTPPEPAAQPRSGETAPAVQPVPEPRGDASGRVAELTRNVEALGAVKRSTSEPKAEGRADAARQRQAAPTAKAPERRADNVATPRVEAEPPSPAPAEPAVQAAAPAALPPAAVPAPAPSAAPMPSMAEATTPARKAESAVQQAQADAAARSESRMSTAAGRAAAVAGLRAPVAELAADAAAGSPPFALLRRARGDTAGGIARWTWMPPSKAAIAPMDDAAQDWLARVVQATRGRWSDSAERAGAGDAVEVRWWRDDWPQATLRIEADGLRWIEHSGRIQHAPLDAATLQRLNRF
jgi:hypothetical protein